MAERIVTADDVKRLKAENAEHAAARSTWLHGEGPEPKSNLSKRLEGIRRANLGSLAPNAATTGAQRTTASVAISPPASRLSQADVDRAVSSALKTERARVRKVLGSQASIGRERQAAVLLADDHGWSATGIISMLGELPTDGERVRCADAARQAATGASWDKAYDHMRKTMGLSAR